MTRIPLILSLLALLPASALAQSTWYVPDDFPTIQLGIDGSSNGDTVIVRDGTYVENISFNGMAITLKSENGSATTIIDGNQAGSAVTFASGEGSDSVFEGFTVTKGKADLGGGLSCGVGSSPTLTNCTFTGNTANKDGGGMYCVTASPALDSCTFTDNMAITSGGGMACNSSPTLNNCTFTGNSAKDGGGMHIYNAGSSPTLDNCTFTNNTATRWGGGILQGGSSSLALTNCTFTDNSAAGDGGGIYSEDTMALNNCILWNNGTTNGIGPEIYKYGTITVTYSDIRGGWTGTGNIDADPLFADPANGNFHLQGTSPCIDTGDPNSALDPDGTITDMGAFYFHQNDDDFDDDGLLDADEISTHGTDPQLFDTDGDGLGDGQELGMTDAAVTADTDLSIFKEDRDPSSTTDPLNADTDGGGIDDGHEDQDKNGVFNTWETNPNDSIDDDLAMYVHNLNPGENVVFRVRKGTPNALIIPCYSTAGNGPTDIGIVGVTMSLDMPIHQLPAFRLGSGGYGEVTSQKVPNNINFIGVPVYFQGLEIFVQSGQSFRLTNAITKPITEN